VLYIRFYFTLETYWNRRWSAFFPSNKATKEGKRQWLLRCVVCSVSTSVKYPANAYSDVRKGQNASCKTVQLLAEFLVNCTFRGKQWVATATGSEFARRICCQF